MVHAIKGGILGEHQAGRWSIGGLIGGVEGMAKGGLADMPVQKHANSANID